MNLHYTTVVLVVVVRLDELQLGSQVAQPYDLKTPDLFGTVVLAFPLLERLPTGAFPLPFPRPGGSGLKCVQIQMEGETIQRLAGQVVISERLSRIERVAFGVIPGVNIIGDHPLGERFR